MFERIASENGRVRLQLKGALDAESWLALRDGFAALAAAPEGEVVLDLTNVSFIDGPAIGAIAFLFKRLRAKGRRLVVTGVSGQPLALLREHGLDEVLGLSGDDAHARRRFGLSWVAP
ncbi:STAS domain-containing protein [Limobrevibacterium gyesilva]|uniref:STAS domain-containing protein n=1 Tax=Limobrevibacterium gyesilva TaxID=2991712 RepID=A0AA41YRX6_9PROT|nr:STAS domain-containing protein [Limobrevibacterium gyesilva]MCW3475405.1 STAS domain-containing protein [Limobrevibacterium gyesilva]